MVLYQDIMAYKTFGISRRNIKFDRIKFNYLKMVKKILLSFLLLLFIIPASMGQFTKIGASLGYDYRYVFNNETADAPTHKLKNPVLSVTAIYEVNLPFHIVPRFNIYMPNINKVEDQFSSNKTTISGYSLDIDGHYVVNYLDKYEIYALAGINILYAQNKWVYEIDGGESTSDVTTNTALGLNMGAGGYWKIRDEFDLFFEARAVLFDHPAAGIKLRGIATAGILINLEYLKNKEGRESGY